MMLVNQISLEVSNQETQGFTLVDQWWDSSEKATVLEFENNTTGVERKIVVEDSA